MGLALRNITASVVLYGQTLDEVRPLFESLAADPAVLTWAVVDNGGSMEAMRFAKTCGALCIEPGRNLGFGAGHNLALRSMSLDAPYHAILNPDIRMETNVLTELAVVMDNAPDVGLVMPKVSYPDGSIQYLCKLLPTPWDLISRRFGSGAGKTWLLPRGNDYDMRSFGYDEPVHVPVLSGCFMFLRRATMELTGGFDERFFLYMEDTDLCRRLGAISHLLFWPYVSVVHTHTQGSYKSKRLLKLHIQAAMKYFNKWGWFWDRERAVRNRIGREPAVMTFDSRNTLT